MYKILRTQTQGDLLTARFGSGFCDANSRSSSSSNEAGGLDVVKTKNFCAAKDVKKTEE